jgi:glycosyltransferase involved in cell wall biosynthesis
VLIVYKSLPAYRRDFYSALRTGLAGEGIQMDLAYGDPIGQDRWKSDSIELPWAINRPNRSVTFMGRHLVWQPVWDLAKAADLVIVEQASKLLVNYGLLLRQRLRGRPKVALWGHGANLQIHTASALSEAMKRRYSRLPHWWFAYTEGSRDRVARLGFPMERITVVQNAIDTRALVQAVEEVQAADLDDFRSQHGCSEGSTALFVGGLYQEKRLEFLFDAAVKIRERRPGFVLLVGGDGPMREMVENAADKHQFIRYLGRLDGAQRHLALRAADVVLMPGLVGLAILDAFAAEAPLITTAIDFHSPEIEYLESGVNGLCVQDRGDPEAYAAVVADLLADVDRLSFLRTGCRTSASQLTNEAMVANFQEGILRALGPS